MTSKPKTTSPTRSGPPRPPETATKVANEELAPEAKIAVVSGEQLSEMELALTVLWNSVRRWMSQRSMASDGGGLSDLDVFILHLIVYRNRPLRVVDLAFALSIDDLHQVTYSLKKLVRLDMLGSTKHGKEVFYSATERGCEHYEEFIRDRQKYLEPSIQFLVQGDQDLAPMIGFLKTLSGVYEQAARSAASSRQV